MGASSAGQRSTLLLGVLLGGALAAACAGSTPGTGRASAPATSAPAAPPASASTPAASAAPALQSMRSAYTTLSAATAPWWVAQEAGYFREQGLDVTLTFIDAGAALLAALSNGEVDIAMGGVPTFVLGQLQGLDTVVIGSTLNMLDGVVYVRPELQRIEDLKGKTVGVTRLKAITDVAARLAFRRVGLEPDVDVFTRGTGGNTESLAAMETGVLDGASLNVPFVFEAGKRGYRPLLDITSLKIEFASSGAGTTRRLLAQRPELGEPYLRALAQGVSRLKTDRDYAIAVIGKYTQLDDRELLGATVDYYRDIYSSDPYPERAAVQTVIDVEEDPRARTLKPEDVTDYRYADALRASGFLDRLPK